MYKGCLSFFSEISDSFIWNKLNPESNNLKIYKKFSLKSKIHFEIFPRNDFKFPEKTTYNFYTTITVFRCQGRNAKNQRKNFRKFVTGCDIKATKCDISQNSTLKIIEKSLLEPILWIFQDWSFDPTNEPPNNQQCHAISIWCNNRVLNCKI